MLRLENTDTSQDQTVANLEGIDDDIASWSIREINEHISEGLKVIEWLDEELANALKVIEWFDEELTNALKEVEDQRTEIDELKVEIAELSRDRDN